MTELKLGKLPARYCPKDLHFLKYKCVGLPEAPVGFTHTGLLQNPWGMLGNDAVGDCAIAGPAHEHMLWNAAAGIQTTFTTEGVLGVYSAITGYDPTVPGTDQGSDVHNVLEYRKTTGMPDANGTVHKIGAYIALEPGNWHQLLQALWLFEAVGIGFEVPSSAMDQFSAGQPWTVVPDTQIEGGHYVPVVSRVATEEVQVVTWGALQSMSKSFYEKYCDEAWAILSSDMLDGTTGKSLEGFDIDHLLTDISNIN